MARWADYRAGEITRDVRGRARIWLGRSSVPVDGWREVEVKIRRLGPRSWLMRRFWVHPAANSGGWQWLSRYRVWEARGERLRTDEHAHHEDLDLTNDSPANIAVLLAEYHGRLHGWATVLYRLRDEHGRFLPGSTRPWSRAGAVLGPAAKPLS